MTYPKFDGKPSTKLTRNRMPLVAQDYALTDGPIQCLHEDPWALGGYIGPGGSPIIESLVLQGVVSENSLNGMLKWRVVDNDGTLFFELVNQGVIVASGEIGMAPAFPLTFDLEQIGNSGIAGQVVLSYAEEYSAAGAAVLMPLFKGTAAIDLDLYDIRLSGITQENSENGRLAYALGLDPGDSDYAIFSVQELDNNVLATGTFPVDSIFPCEVELEEVGESGVTGTLIIQEDPGLPSGSSGNLAVALISNAQILGDAIIDGLAGEDVRPVGANAQGKLVALPLYPPGIIRRMGHLEAVAYDIPFEYEANSLESDFPQNPLVLDRYRDEEDELAEGFGAASRIFLDTANPKGLWARIEEGTTSADISIGLYPDFEGADTETGLLAELEVVAASPGLYRFLDASVSDNTWGHLWFDETATVPLAPIVIKIQADSIWDVDLQDFAEGAEMRITSHVHLDLTDVGTGNIVVRVGLQSDDSLFAYTADFEFPVAYHVSGSATHFPVEIRIIRLPENRFRTSIVPVAVPGGLSGLESWGLPPVEIIVPYLLGKIRPVIYIGGNVDSSGILGSLKLWSTHQDVAMVRADSE